MTSHRRKIIVKREEKNEKEREKKERSLWERGERGRNHEGFEN